MKQTIFLLFLNVFITNLVFAKGHVMYTGDDYTDQLIKMGGVSDGGGQFIIVPINNELKSVFLDVVPDKIVLDSAIEISQEIYEEVMKIGLYTNVISKTINETEYKDAFELTKNKYLEFLNSIDEDFAKAFEFALIPDRFEVTKFPLPQNRDSSLIDYSKQIRGGYFNYKGQVYLQYQLLQIANVESFAGVIIKEALRVIDEAYQLKLNNSIISMATRLIVNKDTSNFLQSKYLKSFIKDIKSREGSINPVLSEIYEELKNGSSPSWQLGSIRNLVEKMGDDYPRWLSTSYQYDAALEKEIISLSYYSHIRPERMMDMAYLDLCGKYRINRDKYLDLTYKRRHYFFEKPYYTLKERAKLLEPGAQKYPRSNKVWNILTGDLVDRPAGE